MKSDINYSVPVIVHHHGDDLPATLTVTRRADAKYWEAKLLVRPDLWHSMYQAAHPSNGGDFANWDDKRFLERVQLVFDFVGGIDFDFLEESVGSGAQQ